MGALVPLHVLTGFLGSGKTTLLSALLQAPRDERIAVLVNEAGELALDHHLLERIDEDIVALPSGCLCCTIRSELHVAIERVVAFRPARIVLETTGLADPAPILHSLTADPWLARTLELAGVVAVADATRLEHLLAAHPEVHRQLELADRVVLAKGDLAPERVPEALRLLARAAPGAEARPAVAGRIDADWLLAHAPLTRLRAAGDARTWLHHEHGGRGDAPDGRAPGTAAFRTHSVCLERPARVELLQLWLRLVTQLDGPRLLRIKALVECAESGALWALQSAEHAVSPPRRLERRPSGVRGVQVVVIERGLPDGAVRHLLESLQAAAAGTRAVPPARAR